MTQIELDDIFHSLDAIGNGKVEYTEWLAATMEPSVLTSESAMKELYHYFDHDHKGRIASGDLSHVLGADELGASGILEYADKCGSVDFEHFKVLMHAVAAKLERRTQHSEKASAAGGKQVATASKHMSAGHLPILLGRA